MDVNSYEALRRRAAWIDLTGRGKIRVTGEDRLRLIHNMCTNRVLDLTPGMGCYAFFLTAQGRIIADANIYCMTDYVLLDTEPEAKQRLFDHLNKFIIADDVILHDFTNDYGTISLEGPTAEEILRSMEVPAAHLAFSIAEYKHCEVAHASYTGQSGYRVFFPIENRDEIIRSLTPASVPQADLGTADVVRLENGRPKFGTDIRETHLPQETPLMVTAVHTAKGCYLGQEIVERVRSRGHVNRLLTPLEIESEIPPAGGAKIDSGGKEVGEITSAAFSPDLGKVVGFGVVRSEALGGPLQLNGAKVTVRSAAR